MATQSPTIEQNKLEYLADSYEVKDNPLWYHLAGLSQTASGYGGKLTSSKMLRIKGEKIWRRIYVMCYSNNGTSYILIKGRKVIIR